MELLQGDCFDVMQSMVDNSIDLVLTDPPYGLKFMGKKWDYDVPSVEIWAEALRVLKPGGHMLAFAGTRTQHRMACRIEDAGFEIRDMLAWMYGSGFPKSLDVSKAIDKASGIWRGKAGAVATPNRSMGGPNYERTDKGEPATDAAREWDGWGTALKPALEPITMARKPLVGTVAANVLEYGTGALNIGACRVGTEKWTRPGSNGIGGVYGDYKNDAPRSATGRWPANLIHDGSDEVVQMFPNTKSRKQEHPLGTGGMFSDVSNRPCAPQYGDSGSAARFFASFPLDDLEQETNCRIKYCAKASRRERGEANTHATVKPIALMEYLVKLASSEGQTILDPFMGSGTTGIACQNLNRNFIGIEMNEEYFEIARNRINNAVVEALF